jgi:hypothetical protein
MHPQTQVIADERYVDWRKRIDAFFVSENRLEAAAKTVLSPCGNYRLEICQYSTGPSTWIVSRGIVTCQRDGQLIADVKRNHGHFWHAWVKHPNGNDYLLCGEDYQGYSVINLTTGKSNIYFPDAGYKGGGFCWTAVYASPERLMLAVDGCYWACPYEIAFFDFRHPDQLPLTELARTDNGCVDACQGWIDNETFVFTCEIEIRKSDGARYDSLSPREQERLDNDSSLVDYRIEEIRYKPPPFARVCSKSD